MSSEGTPDGWALSESGHGPCDPSADSLDGNLHICFSTTNALLSRWIRMYTGSRVSHAIITFRSTTLDLELVMEAHSGGYRVVPWSKWSLKNTLIARFELVNVSAADRSRALRLTARKLGAPYDTIGLFGFVPRLWGRIKSWWRVRYQGRAQKKRLIPTMRNVLDNPKNLFCSEAVAGFLGLATGSEDFERPQDWSPKNLFDYALAKKELFRAIDNDLNSATTKYQQQKLPKVFWKPFIEQGIEPGSLSEEERASVRARAK